MNKLIVTLLFLLFTFPALFANAQEFTIPDEVTVTRNKAEIDTITILMNTKTAKVLVRHGHNDGSGFVSSGKTKLFIFRDVVDDPSTPQDETKTDFTDFLAITKIDKNALKLLMKGKY